LVKKTSGQKKVADNSKRQRRQGDKDKHMEEGAPERPDLRQNDDLEVSIDDRGQ
jgi:hypothetical protein